MKNQIELKIDLAGYSLYSFLGATKNVISQILLLNNMLFNAFNRLRALVQLFEFLYLNSLLSLAANLKHISQVLFSPFCKYATNNTTKKYRLNDFY